MSGFEPRFSGLTSLSTPEVRCSNPVIGKSYIEHLLSIVMKGKKDAGIGPFKNINKD